ncbi:hypothetical protein PILCRDRAFT_815037 [Piloderma croceum F 1598]|uniref:Uncharacterized protein n=1 Tax=Piloderma croceum (strain F 1598) TaxID=765440 RepID=A0A0C3G6S4_PILCF|nr:hypothetical protein PILCRDRAFT_815037 [Piloderma croceum F 1598]
MIVSGADTGHGDPGMKQPSVSSIVWSWERNAFKYKALMRLQEPSTEITKDLYEMMEACDAFAIWRHKSYFVLPCSMLSRIMHDAKEDLPGE